MSLDVMLATKPHNLKRLGIVGVVALRLGGPAEARLSMDLAALDGGAERLSGVLFLWVAKLRPLERRAPFGRDSSGFFVSSHSLWVTASHKEAVSFLRRLALVVGTHVRRPCALLTDATGARRLTASLSDGEVNVVAHALSIPHHFD